MERLASSLEDLDAKCLYCGGKMDTLISTLQTEIPEIPNLSPETENTLFLAIAGLKQVHLQQYRYSELPPTWTPEMWPTPAFRPLQK